MQPKVSVSFLAHDFTDLDDFVAHIKANLPRFDVLKISVVAYEAIFDTEFSNRLDLNRVVEEEYQI